MLLLLLSVLFDGFEISDFKSPPEIMAAAQSLTPQYTSLNIDFDVFCHFP